MMTMYPFWRLSIVQNIFFLLSAIAHASSQQCSLCGNSSLPIDSLQRERNGIYCRDLFDGLIDVQNPDECGEIQLTAFQTGCCDGTFLPDVCSICPENAPFQTATPVPATEGRPELTCADLQGESSFWEYLISPGDCSDTFLRRSAGWCGCSGQEIYCPICPDGSRPPEPTKTEKVLYGWDCSVFEYVLALLSESECYLADEILEFDASAFCCPHLAAPPDVCSFCPESQVVIDPDIIISSEYGPVTCGDIDDSMRLIPTIEACQYTQQKFDAALCCGQIVASDSDSRGVTDVLQYTNAAIHIILALRILL